MMNQRKRRQTKKAIVIAALGLFFFSLFYFAMRRWEQEQDVVRAASASDRFSYKGRDYLPRTDLSTFLLIGVDKFEAGTAATADFNNQQSDFILLLVVDEANQTYRGLHLNRDTMAQIDILGKNSVRIDTVTQQLALAHTYGTGEQDSCCYTKRTVSRLLRGVRINHYAAVTMDAVPTVNDLLGGVTVTLTDDFTDLDPSMKPGRTMNLMGDQALIYVRARGSLSDKTNLNRMKRQQEYLTAAISKFDHLSGADPEFVANTVWEVFPYVTSDLTADQVSGMIDKLAGYSFCGLSSIEGESVRGPVYMEYHLDEDSLMQTLLELFCIPAAS